MTENEDIEKILYMGVGRSGIDNENSKIAKALNELMQYRAIGTVEEFKALKEKNVAKKPIDKIMYLECPTCGDVGILDCDYCSVCGQKLDWD